jgi:hypothetical protein
MKRSMVLMVLCAAALTATAAPGAQPKVARWTGKGSTSDAASFRCVSPEKSDREDDD